jgi:hypothetical protein
VIDGDTASETDSDDDNDDDEDDDEDDDAMPGLQERDLYDSDSDDEEEEEEDEEENEDEQDDDEQSAGVLDDESTGMEVEMVEEEETQVPHVSTKGVPSHNTRTRYNRRVRQTHLDSDFIYTNYSSSLTHSQSHITRTTDHVPAMHALVNYGQVMPPGIKNVVMGLAMAQQYHVNKGLV